MEAADFFYRLTTGALVVLMALGLVAVLLERFVTDEPEGRSDDEIRRDARIHAEWPRSERDEQGRR
jgi:hypothetical protein